MKAHPDDILMCANMTERRHHPQFTDRQVVPLARRDRLKGRRVRHIWYTAPAMDELNGMPTGDYFSAIRPFDHAMRLGNGKLRAVEKWEPDQQEPVNLLDQIQALSAGQGTGDYGRGYSEAIEAAIELITATLTPSLD